jgi:hypothetical protein
MTHIYTDIAFLSYAVMCLVSLYGFLLFLWWWYKIKKVSDVYAYITYLFASMVFVFAPQIYARYLLFVDKENYTDLLRSSTWELRSIPAIIVLLIICIKMTIRTYYTIKSSKRFELGE